MKFLIGTDPEAFVRIKGTNEIVSAIGLIPGCKDEPFAISDEGHAIQTDNVMVEFCVPATSNPVELYNHINFCIADLNKRLPENMEVVIQASAFLDDKWLDNEQARLFGCDPDFNAYTFEPNVAPSADTNLRTAGGHIHIGYEDHDQMTSMKIIHAMDLFLGIPSLILDKDTERRKMYGKAGCHRLKKYGVEYRTLSNFWIASQEHVNWMYRQTERAVEYAMNEDFMPDDLQAAIQLAINNQDINLACRLAKAFDILLTLNEPVLV